MRGDVRPRAEPALVRQPGRRGHFGAQASHRGATRRHGDAERARGRDKPERQLNFVSQMGAFFRHFSTVFISSIGGRRNVRGARRVKFARVSPQYRWRILKLVFESG